MNRLLLSKFFSKTLLLTLLVFVLLVVGAEASMRLEIFHELLTPPKMESRHYQLGHKLTLLNAEVKKNGPVDCIAVGSSMIDVGFDPVSFQNGYQKVAGQDVRCFNFGIDASSATSTAALGKILVEDYHPRLLIFGTDPRDYAIPSHDAGPDVILESAWIKYRLGSFSVEGWLLDHSYFYRYRTHLSRLARFYLDDTLWSRTKVNFEILANGLTPLTKLSTDINHPPNLEDDSFEITYNTSLFSSYKMYDENLFALQQIMDYENLGTRVVVVEMPVSDGLYYFFGNGEQDYNRFIDQITEIAERNNVLFLRTEPLDFIPDDGWSDYSHVNMTGAKIFSNWLGRTVGELEN